LTTEAGTKSLVSPFHPCPRPSAAWLKIAVSIAPPSSVADLQLGDFRIALNTTSTVEQDVCLPVQAFPLIASRSRMEWALSIVIS